MRKGPHPAVFLLVILPFGASFGYVSVALNYLAVNREHVPVAAFAKVIAAAFFVHGIKFLWAPVVDKTLTKRTWYLIALGLTVAGTLASSVMPLGESTLPALTLVVVASQLGLTLMGMACENFLGDLPDGEKGRASGWYQAGNFIGLGLGGDLALELSSKLPHGWMVGAVMGALMLPCALALIWIPEPPRHEGSLLLALKGLLLDLVGLLVELRWDRQRHPGPLAALRERLARTTPAGRQALTVALNVLGITGLMICLSPVGSGAAANLWPSIATDWHASQQMVARVTGAFGGLAGGLGALLGGVLADRLNRRLAYALAGFVTALTATSMAFGPRTDWAYAAFTLLYALFNGMAFAAFSAFVLETIGQGSVATKYNIFASLANIAIGYMTRIDSSAYARPLPQALKDHASTMLFTDAGCTLLGIVGLLLMVAVARRFAPPAAVAPATPATEPPAA